jgi:hypothetical protein
MNVRRDNIFERINGELPSVDGLLSPNVKVFTTDHATKHTSKHNCRPFTQLEENEDTGSIPDSAVIQTRSVVLPGSIDSNLCFICKENSFKRDFKLHKIESSERLDSLMSRAQEHSDLMMLKTLNKPGFLASAVYHSGWRVLFIIRGALEDFYCIRWHLKLNLKKLSSPLMRLPLTALFLESVMTFLYTRKLFLCLIFLKYTSHFYQKMFLKTTSRLGSNVSLSVTTAAQ